MKHWKIWATLIVLAVVGLYIADFYFERWVHYKLSYESLVKSEIKAMVKASCLQE
jgi:Ni,Fe-hydrogenase I cytochrome b subunit